MSETLEGNSPGSGPGASLGRRKGGFTLVELLVVLAILGMIMAVVGPRVMKHLSGAKSDSARIQIENLSTSLDLYKLELGIYPGALEDLVSRPQGMDGWNGPYLKKARLPKDPWGRDYQYSMPGEHGPYDLYSLGKDGAEGGDGEDADVLGWE